MRRHPPNCEVNSRCFCDGKELGSFLLLELFYDLMSELRRKFLLFFNTFWQEIVDWSKKIICCLILLLSNSWNFNEFEKSFKSSSKKKFVKSFHLNSSVYLHGQPSGLNYKVRWHIFSLLDRKLPSRLFHLPQPHLKKILHCSFHLLTVLQPYLLCI